MGLNQTRLCNAGGGGGNSINGGPFAINAPIAGDFLILIIWAQFGLPSGGYVPVQPVFNVRDDIGQRWQNLFDVYEPNGTGGSFNSQYSMSVWFCDNAKGLPFNLSYSSTAIPFIGNQSGNASFQDWRLENRAQISTVQKLDASNTATPSLPAFAVGANQLSIAAFFAPSGVAPILVSATPGYTQMQNFGTTSIYLDEYLVRPSPNVAQQPSIVTTAAEQRWLMAGLLIDISQPALQVGQILMPDYRQMPIEE